MVYTNLITLLGCGLLGLCLAYSGPDLPPGPYCGISGQCCTNREDGCSHPILDSLCYCDEFCNRTNGHDDCCPDYPEVCLGIKPPLETVLGCRHGQNFYSPGDVIIKGCNKCTCRQPDFADTDHWDCETDECMISNDVIYRVNADSWLGWRAANYSQFREKKLKDGLIYKLGTLRIGHQLQRMGALKYDKEIPYPHKFDSRDRWGGYITPIMDQGWCGSDWAITIASVASDRLAIQSNGAEKVVLSPQNLLSCSRGQLGCKGGHIDSAWIYMMKQGIVDDVCYPYTGFHSHCKLRWNGNLIDDGCRPEVPERTSRYKVGPPGKLVKEKDIMYDIMESGPVQAVMTVYQDFFHYRDGIYKRSRHGNNELKGLHSVKIIGWGEENRSKYWLVANTWGTDWGENGYFRIVRGENESGIESFIVSAVSEVNQAYKK